jgi:hypothetical protein
VAKKGKDFELSFQYRGKYFKDAEKGLERFAEWLKTSLTVEAPKELGKTMTWFLKGVASAMQQRHHGRWPGGTGPYSLSRRSGKAMTSVQRSVHVTGWKGKTASIKKVAGRIGGNFYLRVNELGTVGKGGTMPSIKAKNGKYMTVPLNAAMDSRGVKLKERAADWQNTFTLTAKDGRKYIAQRRGDDLVLLYILLEKVDIPPRLGMGDTLEKGLPFFVEKAMLAMRDAVMKKSGTPFK